ncbi:MAG: hypothetical protein RLZZ271_576 [Pseudomonadota bacterium]|jgi:S-adenosylmethionine decarboxylase proenzyme
MYGLHLTADLHECRCDAALLLDAERLGQLARQHTQSAGLHIVGECWHCFPEREQPGGGVTGVLLLAESHLAIHTWPELGAVTLDVYVCNLGTDNSTKARQMLAGLEQAFRPGSVQRGELMRGTLKSGAR